MVSIITFALIISLPAIFVISIIIKLVGGQFWKSVLWLTVTVFCIIFVMAQILKYL